MTRVLIIDDEELVRVTLRQALELAGYEVAEATNGNEGVKLALGDPPDLVITDIIMPEKEGIETIAEIRREHPSMKIIAVSGGGRMGKMDFLQIAGKLGADRTLPKPFDPDDLVAMVQELLGARQ